METSKQWQLARGAAERYERILVPAILGPAAQALVDWTGLRDGETVVDVGCGTGAAAQGAAKKVGPHGRVAGVDLNPGMIDVARSLPTNSGAPIEWFEDNAYALPFAEREFDVALCAQTLQFLEDQPGALAEMYRILKPKGRVAVSLWCDIGESPYFHALVETVVRHIGPDTAAGLGTAFSLSDAGVIRSLLSEARFRNVEMTVEQLDLDLPKAHEFVPRHISATPMTAGFSAASEEVQSAVVQEMSERLAPYETDSGMRVPFFTHLMMGSK